MNVTINYAGFPTPGLPNQGWKVWIPLVVMIIISGLFVIARITSRQASRQIGADDYAIILSLMSCITQTTLWALAVRAGYGANYLDLDTFHRRLFNKWWFLGSVFYPITLALFKTSVILLNKRIFVQRGFQITCWITLLVNGCWALGNTFGWLFQCVPIAIMWGAVQASTGRCFDLQGIWISLAVWDVLSDVWILAIAVPMVWKLHMRIREKIMLLGLFMLGAVVIVFSVMSCGAVIKSLQAEAAQANQYSFALANLFQVLESNVGIIGACLPVMRQPLKQMFPSLFSDTEASKSRPTYYYDDEFTDQYVLQQNTNRKRGGTGTARHDVSISGPEMFSKTRKESDELRIINDTTEIDNRDSGGEMETGRSASQTQNGIRMDTIVSVDRFNRARNRER